MRKALVLAVVVLFSVSVVSAFAGSACAQGKGKPLSKTPGKGMFQAASDHIGCWGKSTKSAKQKSLRGAQEPTGKRGSEIQIK
ncbi:MAG: hypothetical protein WBB86_00595 [Candidatus Omnitrophota bacterium]